MEASVTADVTGASTSASNTWYVRDTYSGDVAYTVDANGNIITGEDLLASTAIPGAVRKFPVVTRNGSMVYGQSNAAGRAQPALTTSAPYSTNKSFVGGPRQRSTTGAASIENDLDDEGYGNLGESICTSAMAETTRRGVAENGLTAANIPQFSSNAAKPGVGIASLKDGTTQWTIMQDHLVKAKGIAVAAGETYEITDMMWLHGETDTQDGTTYADYMSQFTVNVVEAISEYARSLTDQRRPVFTLVAQHPYRNTLNDGPARALYDAARGHPLVRYVMNLQCVPQGGDNLHFNNIGQKLMGYYFGRARKQLWLDGVEPDYLKPLSAVYDGTYVTISFDVPTSPLVIDTSTIAAATQNGVKVTDASGNVTLSAFSVVNSTQLRCTPGRAIVGDWVVRLGLDYSSSSITFDSSGAVNLRDSTNEPTTISGTPYETWHWAPQCEFSGTTV